MLAVVTAQSPEEWGTLSGDGRSWSQDTARSELGQAKPNLGYCSLALPSSSDTMNEIVGRTTMPFDPLTPPPLLTADLPGVGGCIKTVPEDFEVEEIPAYQPCGTGDYLYLWV